jgi:uncharacterized repeat protein (TIGR03943 family)
MSRETENALLLLVGVSAGLITLSGAFTRYVKPSLLPWLATSAVLLIALALVSITRDIRSGPAHEPGNDHRHRSGALWLLMIPVALLAFVVPPAIGANASSASVREVSTDVLRHPFPPLPAERAPELSVPEVLMRVAQDSAGTLDNRLVTVTGFVTRDDDTTYLGRVVIICCAADAQLARIRLRGPPMAATHLTDGTWVRIEGKVPPGQSDSSRRAIPAMEVSQVTRIDPPPNTYAY